MNEVGAGAGGGTTETESDEMLRTRPNTIKRSTPTGEYAVRGARIECDFGSRFDVVNIPLCHGVYSGEHPLVSVKDMKVRENICNGFGRCITPEGEEYDCMKEIRVDHEWINESKVRFHIDGEEVLATGALTMCSKHGGGIYVVESGQNGKYVTQSTDEVNVAEKRNMMNSLGEGADSIKDVPEIPAAILAGLTTIDVCEAKIKELGQMWHDAGGNPALQEYYHRQANQIREHILVLGKTAPVSKEYLESIRRQLGSVDGSDSLKISSTVGEDLLGVEVKNLDELAQSKHLIIPATVKDLPNTIEWPEGYEEWTFNEQLAYVEQKKFKEAIEKYLDWREVGTFLNVTLSIGFFDFGLEIVWYDGGVLKHDDLKHEFLGVEVEYPPVYSKPFVYLISGMSTSINKETVDMLLDYTNYSEKIKNVKANFTASVGKIIAKERTNIEQSEIDYFDDPTDYNGTFISNSLSWGPVVGSAATDPNNICETVAVGLNISVKPSFVPTVGGGGSTYMLIPQEEPVDKLVDYIMAHQNIKTHKNGGRPDQRHIHERSVLNGNFRK